MTPREQQVADFVSVSLRENLEDFIGKKRHGKSLEAISAFVDKLLNSFSQKRIIHQYRVGEVYQLWATWNLKQKLKWTFYNKTPIVKDLSDMVRKEINDYNSILHELDEIGQNFNYDTHELPEHLICSPKSIIIANVMVKPIQALDFVVININVGDLNVDSE